MGKTNVVLDDKLVGQCRKATGIKTIRGVIDHALHELLRLECRKKAVGLKGAVQWRGNLAQWRKGRW